MSLPCGHHNFCTYSDEEENQIEEVKNKRYTRCKNQGCILNRIRNEDGSLILKNPHLHKMEEDHFHHLGFTKGIDDFVELFGDVKFVVMGGSANRILKFAEYMQDMIGHTLPRDFKLTDLSASANRFSMYKIGPVISVSHGMGVSSLVILLHEMIKLVGYAKCKNPIFIRIGSCGGIGIEPGTVVVSSEAVDGMLGSQYELPILGRIERRPAIFDKTLAKSIQALSLPEDNFKIVTGKTMCALDFYEGQGRLDGSICTYSEEDRLNYLKSIKDAGVVNIEMEVIPLAALTYDNGIKAACVDVSYLDRLNGDQVTTPKEILGQFEERPQQVVGRYIKKYLESKNML